MEKTGHLMVKYSSLKNNNSNWFIIILFLFILGRVNLIVATIQHASWNWLFFYSFYLSTFYQQQAHPITLRKLLWALQCFAFFLRNIRLSCLFVSQWFRFNYLINFQFFQVEIFPQNNHGIVFQVISLERRILTWSCGWYEMIFLDCLL